MIFAAGNSFAAEKPGSHAVQADNPAKLSGSDKGAAQTQTGSVNQTDVKKSEPPSGNKAPVADGKKTMHAMKGMHKKAAKFKHHRKHRSKRWHHKRHHRLHHWHRHFRHHRHAHCYMYMHKHHRHHLRHRHHPKHHAHVSEKAPVKAVTKMPVGKDAINGKNANDTKTSPVGSKNGSKPGEVKK